MLLGIYRFPKVLKGTYLGPFSQTVKLVEEAEEAHAAVMDADGEQRLVEELLDSIWAAETELRRHSAVLVLKTMRRVVRKNRERGYCR